MDKEKSSTTSRSDTSVRGQAWGGGEARGKKSRSAVLGGSETYSCDSAWGFSSEGFHVFLRDTSIFGEGTGKRAIDCNKEAEEMLKEEIGGWRKCGCWMVEGEKW